MIMDVAKVTTIPGILIYATITPAKSPNSAATTTASTSENRCKELVVLATRTVVKQTTAPMDISSSRTRTTMVCAMTASARVTI